MVGQLDIHRVIVFNQVVVVARVGTHHLQDIGVSAHHLLCTPSVWIGLGGEVVELVLLVGG